MLKIKDFAPANRRSCPGRTSIRYSLDKPDAQPFDDVHRRLKGGRPTVAPEQAKVPPAEQQLVDRTQLDGLPSRR